MSPGTETQRFKAAGSGPQRRGGASQWNPADYEYRSGGGGASATHSQTGRRGGGAYPRGVKGHLKGFRFRCPENPAAQGANRRGSTTKGFVAFGHLPVGNCRYLGFFCVRVWGNWFCREPPVL